MSGLTIKRNINVKRNYFEGRMTSSTELSRLRGGRKKLIHSPRVSAVSAHLVSRGSEGFCPRPPFQGCLSGEQTWKMEIMCSSGAEGKFVYHFKIKIMSTSKFGQSCSSYFTKMKLILPAAL